VLLPTALYVFLRLYAVLAAPVPGALADLVVLFGLGTAVVAALLSLDQRSPKRLLAYSSMEVMGVAVVGVGLGGIALYGALFLVVAHAFAKTSAFLTTGRVLQRTGGVGLDRLRDLRRRLPFTSGTWWIGAAAVTGAPPFGTFVGELLILSGAIAAGALAVAAVLVGALAVAFLGVNFQIGRAVVASEVGNGAPREADPLWGLLVPWIGLGVTLLLGLAAIPFLSPLLRAGAAALGGTP
jgi:hydrogenase-4 component F